MNNSELRKILERIEKLLLEKKEIDTKTKLLEEKLNHNCFENRLEFDYEKGQWIYECKVCGKQFIVDEEKDSLEFLD